MTVPAENVFPCSCLNFTECSLTQSRKYIDKSRNTDYNEKLLSCPLCELHIDNAKNIFKCSALEENNNNENDNNFDDLYSEDMDKVSSIIKKFTKLWRQRQDLL